MVYVFTAYNEAYSFSKIISNYKEYLPPWYKAKATRFSFEEDACRFLIGKILLQKGLQKLGYFNIGLHDIQVNEFNKPYFNNNLSFNVSHSGKYVICALSETCNVGIDLEEVKTIDVKDFSNCFSANEWLYLKNSDDPLLGFYKLWTRKEAVIKADGRGLQIPLSTFDVTHNQVSINSCNWFINELTIAEGYIAHIATDTICDNHIIQLSM
jgi:4'-phosphopantetheinyl transferase